MGGIMSTQEMYNDNTIIIEMKLSNILKSYESKYTNENIIVKIFFCLSVLFFNQS